MGLVVYSSTEDESESDTSPLVTPHPSSDDESLPSSPSISGGDSDTDTDMTKSIISEDAFFQPDGDPLAIGNVYLSSESVTSTFLSDYRHVGLQFQKKTAREFIRFSCAVKECPSRVRFQNTAGIWRVTVSIHEHTHDTTIRVIRHSEVIRPWMERILCFTPQRKIKSLQEKLQSIFGATVGQGLIKSVRRSILKRTRKDEEEQFERLPHLVEMLQESDPGGSNFLVTNAG